VGRYKLGFGMTKDKGTHVHKHRSEASRLVWDRGVRFGLVLGAAGILAGCSVPKAVNPVEWYRHASGVSKNDPTADSANQRNFEAGGEKEFPNLSSVPPVPTHVLSADERDALTQKLVADRANAKYLDEELRFGQTASVPPPARPAVAPVSAKSQPAPAAEAPKEVSAPEPAPKAVPVARVQEKPLAEPKSEQAKSEQVAAKEPPLAAPSVRNEPEPLTPNPPPPTPALAMASAGAAAPVQASRKAASLPSAAIKAVNIAFAADSAQLPPSAQAQIEQIVSQQRQSGAKVRIVGHAPKGKGSGTGQLLSGFKIALDRANAVAAALGDAGVEQDRIYVETAIIGSESGGMARQAEIFLQD